MKVIFFFCFLNKLFQNPEVLPGAVGSDTVSTASVVSSLMVLC